MTALHASSDEVAEWLNKKKLGKTDGSTQHTDGENRLLQSQKATSSGSSASGSSNVKSASSSDKTKYPFICECFFMTARVLNLGLLKAFSDFKHLVQVKIYVIYLWTVRVNDLSSWCIVFHKMAFVNISYYI